MTPLKIEADLSEEGKCASVPGGEEQTESPRRRQVPGSNAFVPSVAGLMIAGEVIRDLMKDIPTCE